MLNTGISGLNPAAAAFTPSTPTNLNPAATAFVPSNPNLNAGLNPAAGVFTPNINAAIGTMNAEAAPFVYGIGRSNAINSVNNVNNVNSVNNFNAFNAVAVAFIPVATAIALTLNPPAHAFVPAFSTSETTSAPATAAATSTAFNPVPILRFSAPPAPGLGIIPELAMRILDCVPRRDLCTMRAVNSHWQQLATRALAPHATLGLMHKPRRCPLLHDAAPTLERHLPPLPHAQLTGLECFGAMVRTLDAHPHRSCEHDCVLLKMPNLDVLRIFPTASPTHLTLGACGANCIALESLRPRTLVVFSPGSLVQILPELRGILPKALLESVTKLVVVLPTVYADRRFGCLTPSLKRARWMRNTTIVLADPAPNGELRVLPEETPAYFEEPTVGTFTIVGASPVFRSTYQHRRPAAKVRWVHPGAYFAGEGRALFTRNETKNFGHICTGEVELGGFGEPHWPNCECGGL